MTMPNIIMTRIDERLIHGQGQLWVKYLGCNTVIVANDRSKHGQDATNSDENSCARLSCYAFLPFAKGD